MKLSRQGRVQCTPASFMIVFFDTPKYVTIATFMFMPDSLMARLSQHQ